MKKTVKGEAQMEVQSVENTSGITPTLMKRSRHRRSGQLGRLVMLPLVTIISLASLATPSFARSSTGYDSFKINYSFTPAQAGYNCMRETYGAVWNACGITVYLMFDLAIDNTGVHQIDVLNYWAGTGSVGVSCSAWTYDARGGGTSSPIQTFNAGGQEKLTWNSPNVQPSKAMTLFCAVPPTQGIASINWTP